MKKLLKLFELFSCISLFAIVALTMLQAILRSFFSIGLNWTNELLYFSQICLVYLIVPVLFGYRENIRVDAFTNLLPKRGKKWASVLVELISLSFGVVFFISITQFLQKTIHNSTAIMQIPNYIYYGPLWLGMFVANITMILNIIVDLKEKGGKE